MKIEVIPPREPGQLQCAISLEKRVREIEAADILRSKRTEPLKSWQPLPCATRRSMERHDKHVTGLIDQQRAQHSIAWDVDGVFGHPFVVGRGKLPQ